MEMQAKEAGDGRLWIMVGAAAAALIGLGDSIYLTAEHLAGRAVRCTVIAGCSQVLASSYAKIAGMPTASLGILAYFIAFSLATLALFGYRSAWQAFGWLAAAMGLVTLWFLYLQAFVLRAFCQYCLLSAATTFTLVALAAIDRFIEKRSGS